MKYFKINYDRLKNLNQHPFFIFITFIIILFVIFIILACFIKISVKIESPSIYQNDKLILKINTKLSDTLKSNKHIIFNNQKIKYKKIEYGEFEIINNDIYQDVFITIDKKFIVNEVGIIQIYYDEKPLIKYIFELFK